MKDQSIKKVVIIGSGPIIIGQAAEFDYAGTQACRALKEEGVQVVLVNSNPATIMTVPTGLAVVLPHTEFIRSLRNFTRSIYFMIHRKPKQRLSSF